MSNETEIEPAMTRDEWRLSGWSEDAIIKRVNAWGSGMSGPWNDRHAIAALALYRQPFGFTHEMVDALQGLIDDYVPTQTHRVDLAEAAIARIAALLPPHP